VDGKNFGNRLEFQDHFLIHHQIEEKFGNNFSIIRND
jgi:hypothetical protein